MKKHAKTLKILMFLAAVVLFSLLCWLLWAFVPRSSVRYSLLAVTGGIFVLAGLWIWFQQRQIFHFADEICDTLDALISGRQPEVERPYEDSVTAKVQGKLLQYYDIMNEGKVQSQRDKQTIQELVSDISHQVKTPIANIQMFTGILQQHQLTEEKRAEFLETMASQINKLDFLMQSLIKMSRLETGTFVLHMEEAPLDKTIAQAISSVWAKADRKNIQLSVNCAPSVTVQHDPKWTAEALGNILDNGVKYTPEGGSISVSVRPWQFYTRIDISDTGIGIHEEHYHDVFQRFYRAQETAAEEGVGLGLYLANGIITRQKGYISVKSNYGEGTTFSVYLLS